MKVFVEGHGCSANLAETEQIKGFLREQSLELVQREEEADCIILNTCGVKKETENSMLNRIRKLDEISQKNSSQLLVVGCLPKINSQAILAVSPRIVQFGTDLQPIASFLRLGQQAYSPAVKQIRHNDFVSIIPISKGCLSACTFCGTKIARGHLKSYTIEEINKKFEEGLKEGIKEFWLTSQDSGCYGFDYNYNVVNLLETLLQNNGDFRIRIGMASPQYLQKYFDELMWVLRDERVYRFLHLPVQSGSDRIIGLMKRQYTVDYYKSLVKKIRSVFPDMTFSTDIIVGFPEETEHDFQETIDLLLETRPDVVNISRYGARQGTPAARMLGQLHGRIKKQRSRIASKTCAEISFENNKKLLGTRQKILVTEAGRKGNFVGRANNYKPVVIENDLRGEFVEAEITAAFPTYLKGSVHKQI